MGIYIASKIVKLMNQNGNPIKGGKALVLGITFKENCPDIRNSKVVDVINELIDFGINVDVYDPLADKQEVKVEYNIDLIPEPQGTYHAVVMAVSHNEFKTLEIDKLKNGHGIIYDIKSFLPGDAVDGRL